MGTRHLICIVLNKEVRLAQYGQWDGYLSGQGKESVSFLLKCDLKTLKESVAKTKMLTEEEFDIALQAKEVPAHLSRNSGSDTLEWIAKGNTELRPNEFSFGADSLMCEWAYVI